MKYFSFFLILLFWSAIAEGQLRLRPEPVPGYEDRLRHFIDTMRIVDTHEHLLDPLKIKKSTVCDFMLLFHHFADDDFISSGMPEASFQRLLTDSLTIKEKWNQLKPYWERSFNTGFNRVASLAASRLFKIDNINEHTVVVLSERIWQAYQKNWFSEVLKDKCRILFLIQDSEDRSFHLEGIRYLNRYDRFVSVRSRKDIEALNFQGNDEIETLDDYLNLLKTKFSESIQGDVVGIKTQLAYTRSLQFENVRKEKAKKVFQRILSHSENDTISTTDLKAFQDFMMHRVLELARDYKLPVQLHTGLQAGNVNSIQQANPVLMTNLFKEYPTVKFVLLHGGYPFGGELATLAKNCPNVYIDLAWLYAISPTYSKKYLSEWLETVPVSKIMAFGGDYHNVENVYAELLIAKTIVAEVLIEKVASGYFSEEEAKQVASMIFFKNAVNLYKLKKHMSQPFGSEEASALNIL